MIHCHLEPTVTICEWNGMDWFQNCSCVKVCTTPEPRTNEYHSGWNDIPAYNLKTKGECMPHCDGKRKLVPSVPSRSNPLLKMKNVFTAPGKHISQCRIKTGKKTGTCITLRDCGLTTKGILKKKIILTGFEEKGNSYWSTASANSSGKYPIKASSTLWLGCFSIVFLNRKLCLVSVSNWNYLSCFCIKAVWPIIIGLGNAGEYTFGV